MDSQKDRIPSVQENPGNAHQSITESTILHTGLRNENMARNIIKVVLSTLIETLHIHDRQVMVGLFPASLAEVIESATLAPGPKTGKFEEHVARKLGIDLSLASEYTLTVFQGLIRELDHEVITALRSRLPDHLGGHFAPLTTPAAPATPPARPRHVRAGRTLASGKPGSSRPLSEATPGHLDSPAVNPNPRGERKLSSSMGPVSTLASGRPVGEGSMSES